MIAMKSLRYHFIFNFCTKKKKDFITFNDQSDFHQLLKKYLNDFENHCFLGKKSIALTARILCLFGVGKGPPADAYFSILCRDF